MDASLQIHGSELSVDCLQLAMFARRLVSDIHSTRDEGLAVPVPVARTLLASMCVAGSVPRAVSVKLSSMDADDAA